METQPKYRGAVDRKIAGALNVWFVKKGYGFILKQNEDAPPSKYYLHVSKILAGQPKPEVGAEVRFDVNPVREGMYPSAINVEIIPVASKDDPNGEPDSFLIIEHKAKSSEVEGGAL